jgi:hypothetical protein
MEQKTRGMSKGCLIGIIIASSLLLLLVVSFITCWVYKEDLAKWAASYSVNELKGEVARNPEIVDTVKFDAMVDGFVQRLKADSLDQAKYSNFMLALQALPKWVEDKKLDSSEISLISDAMVAYYPDLEPLRPIKPAMPSPLPVDTTVQENPADTGADK